MAIIIKNKFVKEDILDESGNKIGEIKFNPNDSTIMKTLTEIIKNFEKGLKDIKALGEIENLPNEKFKTYEEFEKVSDTISKLDKGFDIESSLVEKAINDLAKIFGEETMRVITGGTKDIDSISTIVEFIQPYIKNARKKKVQSYLDNKQSNSNDVME